MTLADIENLKVAWVDAAKRAWRRNQNNLLIGRLQRLMALQTLETSVDFLIKVTVLREVFKPGDGKAQRLVDTMPPSLQTLALDQGLEKWDESIVRDLFRGISKTKGDVFPASQWSVSYIVRRSRR